MSTHNFVDAVAVFKKHATWLTEEDEPMLVSLEIMAENLDRRFSAATMAQFGLSYRYLAKKKGAGEVHDPLAALLEGEDE